MSAEPLDGEFAGPLAQPAVDILPAAAGRKGKPEAEAPVSYPAPTEPALPQPTQDVFHDAAGPGNPVNPWTGAPAEPAALAAMAPPLAASAHVDLPGAPLAGAPFEVLPPAAEEPKKFFGMQVRKPKKAEKADKTEKADKAPKDKADQKGEQLVAPVAAWPTDVGVPAVAHAEPSDATGSYAAPASYAPIDLFSVAPVTEPPSQLPDEALTLPLAAVATPALAVPAVDAPAQDTSGQAAEVQALRSLLEASEAQRLAAETRADQAVTYAQQTQARLQQLEADGQTRIQAAEAKARTAANEAQDWQIRHREAEATIAELAASVAGSEQRMAELRTERDELLSSLEDATAPAAETQTTTS